MNDCTGKLDSKSPRSKRGSHEVSKSCERISRFILTNAGTLFTRRIVSSRIFMRFASSSTLNFI